MELACPKLKKDAYILQQSEDQNVIKKVGDLASLNFIDQNIRGKTYVKIRKLITNLITVTQFQSLSFNIVKLLLDELIFKMHNRI